MHSSESNVRSIKSFADLERENRALEFKLAQAEAAIRALRGEAADLGERTHVEESLRQSEARLELELADTKLLQSISAHLIHDEPEHTLYTKITEAALAIMRSDFASLQLHHPERGLGGELEMLASSGLSQEGKDFWAWVGAESGTTCSWAMRNGERVIIADMLNSELVVGTPDHEMFARAGVLAAQTTPLFSRKGKLLGMISTHWTRHHTPSDRDLNLLDILARQAADLIERKSAEEALKSSKSALLQADRRKDEFLATLGHELRNPLSPIRYALQLLRTFPLDGDTQNVLGMMDRQVAHLVRLIDDLLDISRIGEGKIDLRKEWVTLQNAVRDAAEASHPLINSNRHALTIDLPPEPVLIHADLTRIAQVIGNLLNNAAKYTPPGGRIALSVRSEEGYAVLAVVDNGLGIPAEMLSEIFDLFTQVNRNLERSQGGLGIGLALVKQLIEMHGGDIKAQSAGLNRGSTFTIRLPLKSSE